MPKKIVSAKQINENIDYLFTKINWGKSWMDAKAISIMNELGKDIRALEEQSNAEGSEIKSQD